MGKLFVELWDKTGRVRHTETEYSISGPESFSVSDRFDIVNGFRIELIGFEVDFPAEVAIRDRKRRRSRCGSVERWG